MKTNTNTSLGSLVSAFLAASGHLSPSTQRYYKTCLTNFLWYAQNYGLPQTADITRDHVRDFLNYIRQNRDRWGYKDKNRSSHRRGSPATANHYARVIKRLFIWASEEEDYLEPGHCLCRFKLPPAHYRQVEPYSDAEVKAILDLCEQDFLKRSRFLGSRNKAIVSLFCDTGIRLSELAGISLDDLHSSLKQLRVCGKGQKSRVVPISQQCMAALSRYLMYRTADGSQWLWLSENGDRLNSDSISTTIERLKKRAGVKGGGLSHRFRHYFATKTLESSGNPASLRLLLGHESYAMVHHYTRMLSAQKAIADQERFSPLNKLYQNNNHNDGWGWHNR